MITGKFCKARVKSLPFLRILLTVCVAIAIIAAGWPMAGLYG